MENGRQTQVVDEDQHAKGQQQETTHKTIKSHLDLGSQPIEI